MKTYTHRFQHVYHRVHIYSVRAWRWWRRLDRRYGIWWRAANLAAAVLILVSIAIPLAEQWWQGGRYKLSAEAVRLVGKTDMSLARQLTYDAGSGTYQFNQDALRKDGLPAELQRAAVGAKDKSNAKTYALSVPTDMAKGVSYTDTNTQLSFSLVPEFSVLPGRTVDGHLVFPLHDAGDGTQAIYTLKNNGLKEDIVVSKPTQDSMRFTYRFDVPKTLEVRVIPDSGGAIGVYAADPSLFGDINYGSDADRARVEKARQQGAKTTLVFGLPAPVVKDTSGRTIGNSRFELQGKQLTVIAEGLTAAKGAVTIDPSVVVTSTSDFQTGGNNEGMIDFSTSGQITRGGLTGGTVGTWSTTSSLSSIYSSGISTFGSVVYNGYVYQIGGYNGSGQSGVSYAPINSNGTLGSWSTTTSLPAARLSPRAVAYSGYMYVLGGSNAGGSTFYSTVYYAPINSNGTLGSWSTTTSFSGVRASLGGAAYNGFLYVIGGEYNNYASIRADVQYAPINADGSLGNWTSTTSLSSGRSNLGSFAYNGYLYSVGGNNVTTGALADVFRAPINSDGSIGSWITDTSLPQNLSAGPNGTYYYNGYVYVAGGWNGSGRINTVYYAPLNANGSVGSWRTTTSFATARSVGALLVNNGYAYIIAGGQGDDFNFYNDVQYSAIDPAGEPTSFATLSNNFSTARALACGVAYNGYLYNIGGSTSDSGNNNVTTVQYTALNSTTGNNGSWSSTTSLPQSRGSAGCVAYGGYIYVVGGYTGTSGTASNNIRYAPINGNGTLGSWSNGTNLPAAKVQSGVFIYANSSDIYMYVLGGCTTDGSSACTTAYYNYINLSDGSLGATWNTTSSMASQLGYRGYAQVGNRLYAFGGGTTGPSASAEYTSINSNGTLATWTSTTSMGTAVSYVNGTAVNGCIYALGGENPNGTPVANVQYACPSSSGSISSWANAPNLSVATTDMGVTSYNGYIYGVGGYTTGSATTTQFAYVNNGGSGNVLSWTAQSSTDTCGGALDWFAVTVYNGYLYRSGGECSAVALTSVQYAPINADGSVGSWTNTSSLQAARTLHGMVALNGYVYAISGWNGSEVTSTEYAVINTNGSLGSWAYTTGSVPTAHDTFATAVWNGRIYTLGGDPGATEVAYATPASNGNITSWSTTTSTPDSAYGSSAVAYNGYLYVVGADSGNNHQVFYAPINSNGTVGSWTYTSLLNDSIQTNAVAYNGFIYAVNGASNEVSYAPITANGSLGPWQYGVSTPNNTGANGTSTQTAVLWGGNIYQFDGAGGTSAAIQYGAPSSIPRTAHYSKVIDLGFARKVSSITYNGSSVPGQVNIGFRTADATGVFSSTLGTASGITSTQCTSSVSGVRYLLLNITLDDSAATASNADSATTNANLTDVTVNYLYGTPPPNIRLRAGQTLQLGDLSPLDTCKS